MEPAIPERRSMYNEHDRSSVYMSVEDPNNPGNKVLMLKAVFEKLVNFEKGLKCLQKKSHYLIVVSSNVQERKGKPKSKLCSTDHQKHSYTQLGM